jgi:mannose-1-phosphate guanylyltransferase/mannose-6-phosphate isomerase
MTKILPIIMCGGTGSRVWPESRESLPKQFIPLIGERSTFQTIAEILSDREIFEQPIVITNVDYRFQAAEQLAEMGLEATLVLEPVRRDSGPAVAVAAALAAKRSPDTVVAVLAADHTFSDGALFARLCREAGDEAAAGFIVTFGVKPDHPSTGFGYIKPGLLVRDGSKVRKVEAFVEKPDQKAAEDLIAKDCLWNSGNFVFRADVMLGEIERFEPQMAEAAKLAVDQARRDLGFLVLEEASFAKAPKTSIDYAVMERTEKAAVIPADVGWSDVGLWSTVWRLSARDANGNSLRGNAVALDAQNALVRSSDQLTAVVGLDNVIVVTTQDAVLVVEQGQAHKVKQLVDALKAQKRREAIEHRRVHRPWGYYQSIDEGTRYQVKRIVVKPAGRLSLQKHFHRAEHWVVVRGTAEVARDGEVHIVHENESIYLPIGCEHRMANPGKINLELIEVQTGSYLGEDDIVRIEDVYNRS